MLNRRQFVGAVAATIGLGKVARAQTPQPTNDEMHFVPGGRIGFKRPASLKPHANRWHLLMPDQTFEVFVRERLRASPDWDSVIWEQDGRHALIASDRVAGDIERRRFRYQRHGNNTDFAAEVLAFRDADWLGQIRLSTRRLSAVAPPKAPGDIGQTARWRDTLEEIAASITIRPTLTVPEALAEFQVGMAVADLHPRLSGAYLFLSVDRPRTAQERVGINTAHISTTELAIRPLNNSDDFARANEQVFASLRDMPGSRVVLGEHCRAVIRAESPPAPTKSTRFVSYADAFGRTRTLRLTAAYDAASREATLQALERVLQSLSLPDAA